jgi:hypothetical protein
MIKPAYRTLRVAGRVDLQPLTIATTDRPAKTDRPANMVMRKCSHFFEVIGMHLDILTLSLLTWAGGVILAKLRAMPWRPRA